MIKKRKLSVFEKYLTLWVLLCIGVKVEMCSENIMDITKEYNIIVDGGDE